MSVYEDIMMYNSTKVDDLIVECVEGINDILKKEIKDKIGVDIDDAIRFKEDSLLFNEAKEALKKTVEPLYNALYDMNNIKGDDLSVNLIKEVIEQLNSLGTVLGNVAGLLGIERNINISLHPAQPTHKKARISLCLGYWLVMFRFPLLYDYLAIL